ncbi:MAG: exodeoxyribonuclease III [Cloacibacillus sp.]
MQRIKIATFNVNSVKSRLPILDIWLSSEGAPDVICLQETKCQDAEFPFAFFEERGYHCVFCGMKSYNGVAVISKEKADEAAFGLGEAEEGREESEKARVALVRFGDVTVLNTYIPQGKEIDHPDYQYKLRFIARVRALLEAKCSPEDKVVWVGDLNVAPTDIDVANPKNKKDHVCFHEDVKAALKEAMEWGLVDIFRERLPQEGEYTFWDYRVKDALTRNIGWRIDHILGTQSASSCCTGVHVERSLRAMERPSDHTAVVGIFEF